MSKKIQEDTSKALDFQNDKNGVGFLRSEHNFSRLITNESDIEESDFVLKDPKNALLRAHQYLIQVRIGDGNKSYCPFVKFIEKENGYYLKCFHKKLSEKYLRNVALELFQRFKSISTSKTEFNQKVDPTTTVAILTNKQALSDDSHELIVKIREELRLSFLEEGLMIANMHPVHSPGGLGKRGIENPDAALYVADIPLLMVRRMHKEDYVFMRTPAEKSAYTKYFGEIAPSCPYHH